MCEIQSWCPVEDDRLILGRSRPLISGSDEHTVYIKNSIRFSYFGDTYHRNNLPAGICKYRFDQPATWLCNIFRLGRCQIRTIQPCFIEPLIGPQCISSRKIMKKERNWELFVGILGCFGGKLKGVLCCQVTWWRRQVVTTPSYPSLVAWWPYILSGAATSTGISNNIVYLSKWAYHSNLSHWLLQIKSRCVLSSHFTSTFYIFFFF